MRRKAHPMRRRSSATPVDVPRLLTRQEVADHIGCSLDSVDRRIADGRLPAIRDGRLVRIAWADLQAFLRAAKRWR